MPLERHAGQMERPRQGLRTQHVEKDVRTAAELAERRRGQRGLRPSASGPLAGSGAEATPRWGTESPATGSASRSASTPAEALPRQPTASCPGPLLVPPLPPPGGFGAPPPRRGTKWDSGQVYFWGV